MHSPRVEGVHLRGGAVARGGLRWSDRREDFRTEVLGLMKAQMVKNSVIVPVGAKGGFVVKRPPAPGPEGVVDRAALQEEGIACYRLFISALLDLTDNLVDGAVVPAGAHACATTATTPTWSSPPTRAPRPSPTSPTRSPSGVGFWLGDAFASGGSSGYDHKAMGITARGAWESVRPALHATSAWTSPREPRHRRRRRRHERRRVRQRHAAHASTCGWWPPSTTGTSSSTRTRTPATSFAERARLFALPRSSWADYDPALISAGGGVFSRSAKSIPLSPQVRAGRSAPTRPGSPPTS